MLISPYSRFFLRHRLQFRAYRNHGVSLPFRSADDRLDVESVLRTALANDTARMTLQNRDVVRLTSLDVRPRDNLAILLFRRTDPDASTPFVENLPTKRLRALNKNADDALAVSAHLFIDISGVATAHHPTYRAILEEVPGLGRSYINHIIADLLRRVKYDYTDRHGDTKDTYTVVEFRGIKSESLGHAMRGGSVPYVELVRPGTVEGLDTEGMIVPRDQRMKLMIQATPTQTPGMLDRIKTWAFGHDWNDVLVRVDLPEDRSRIVTLAREADAADVLFVRSQEINVPLALEVCTDTINEQLVAKAKEVFADADGWR
jgi:hypothetical protein